MEGFVDVMSNRALRGLVKVGYTHNTSTERAAQLDGTHSPHPFEVEYFIQVPDPRAVEREAHLRLRGHLEGKKFFRCSREVAIAAVKRSAGEVAKNEFSRVDEEKRRKAALAEGRAQAEAQRKAQAEEDRKAARIKTIYSEANGLRGSVLVDRRRCPQARVDAPRYGIRSAVDHERLNRRAPEQAYRVR